MPASESISLQNLQFYRPQFILQVVPGTWSTKKSLLHALTMILWVEGLAMGLYFLRDGAIVKSFFGKPDVLFNEMLDGYPDSMVIKLKNNKIYTNSPSQSVSLPDTYKKMLEFVALWTTHRRVTMKEVDTLSRNSSFI